MKFLVPFFYRNNLIGDRDVEVPDCVKCVHCGFPSDRVRPGDGHSFIVIGPRWYATYRCGTCGTFKVRVNELMTFQPLKEDKQMQKFVDMVKKLDHDAAAAVGVPINVHKMGTQCLCIRCKKI